MTPCFVTISRPLASTGKCSVRAASVDRTCPGAPGPRPYVEKAELHLIQTLLSSIVSLRPGQSLQSSVSCACQHTLVVQPAADIGDVALANAQGIRVGMHGVVPGHEVVRVLDRRAEDEAGIGQRFKLDRLLAFLEHDDFARRYLLRRCHDALMRRDPGDVVSLGRPKAPPLSALEAHIEVSDALRRGDNAFHTVVFACDNPGGI